MKGTSPTRFAVMTSALLACLMLGVLAGVSAGGAQSSHVLQVETVTTRGQGRPVQAAARTVITTVVHRVKVRVKVPVTVTVTAAAPPAPPAQAPGKPKPKPAPNHHHHGPGPGNDQGGGKGPGQGGDGG